MYWHDLTRKKLVRSAIGAVLAVLCGFGLLKSAFAPRLINYSYDALCVFGSRHVTNEVTYIMMDNDSFEAFHQKRGDMWDRQLHAELLNRLATDNCKVVVMDLLLAKPGGPGLDRELVRAIGRHHEIILRAGYRQRMDSDEIEPVFPAQPFLFAAKDNWGISHLDADADGVVRRHWPFPSPGKFPTLAETAARTAGAFIDGAPHERWLRYYGQQPPWTRMSYSVALKQPVNFFHGQFVFIGVQPKTLAPDEQMHKFQTPYSHLTGQCTAGTEVVITEFLNYLNGESLRRWSALEKFGLLICGFVIGGVLARLRFKQACICAAGIAILVVSAAFALIAVTNFWFPWLLIVVGQLPVALVWSAVNFKVNRIAAQERKNESIKRAPKIPGYRVVEPAFGHGAYGKVWLARNKSGEWRAVKVVLLESFGNDREPYDREYEGVSRYREVSDKHPGLLRVDFVSEKFATHFYYIMELGDPLEPGWEKSEVAYMPRDLNNVRSLAPQKRLPIDECVRIGVVLSDTLEFLHRSGFTHRDIKPQNILFVKGQPKFADVGLITNIRESDQERTAVGTPGYMPPAPEMPGTSQADIYALGMVLYVISTGCSPAVFPELPETLLGNDDTNGFFLLNCIVLRACQPDPKERFESAAEMRQALAELQATVVSAEPTSA